MDNVRLDPASADPGTLKTNDPVLFFNPSMALPTNPANSSDHTTNSSFTLSDTSKKQLTDALNSALKENNFSVQFQYFKNPTTLILKMVDNNTGEVVREFPSEQMLRMFQSMLQTMGLELNQKA